MSWKDDIVTSIQTAANVDLPFGVLCQVIAVREADLECDCSPVDGSPDFVNVRLRPIKTSLSGSLITGQYVIPTIATGDDDGFVYVTPSGPDGGFISMYGDIEKVVLSSSNYGGLPRVIELTEKLNNLENKVNSLISTVNSLISTFNAHTHPYVNVASPAVTSVSTTPGTPESGTLTPTQREDIESTFTFHGSKTGS